MTEPALKNIAASVHRHLLNRARETNHPFNELLQYFAMERFLYRLAKSPHSNKFILKGALLFSVWEAPFSRSTMDIDLLGRLDNNVDAVIAVLRDVCLQEVEPDGFVFDEATCQGERIAEGADYEGVRVRLRANLGNARVVMHVDVGFGDSVVPDALNLSFPTILDFPSPQIKGYSRETAIAEKFHAMVKLGLLNSRMKDFFDIWFLSNFFEFDGATLANAIAATFARRNTAVTSQPVALTAIFGDDATKQAQWKAFVRKSRIRTATPELGQIVREVADFLKPVCEALESGRVFRSRWRLQGPWTRQ